MTSETNTLPIIWEAKIKFRGTEVDTIAKNLPLDEIFEGILNSNFAKIYTQSTRFKQRFFFPQHGDHDTIWKAWVEPWTSLIEHSRDFVCWSLAFHALEGRRFTRNEQILGVLADSIHDIGEVDIEGTKFVGDIPSGIKKPEDEGNEAIVAHRAIEMLPLNYHAIEGTDLKSVLHQAYELVVVGHDSKLHSAHKAREKFDYVRTAIGLATTALYNTDYGVTDTIYWLLPPYSIDWFITRILAFDLPTVCTTLAQEYPNSIGTQLKIHDRVLNHAFQLAEAFIHYSQQVATLLIPDDYDALATKIKESHETFLRFRNSQA